MENIKEEIWIKNNGYKISNKGKIINKNGKPSKQNLSELGYVLCNVVFDDGFKARNVHRAVAYAFIPNPKNKPEVNHIDGDKTNNCVDNLEWVTKKENQQHEALVLHKRGGENCYMSKLIDEIILEMYELCKARKLKYKEIAKIYDVDPSFVSQLATQRVWRHLNLPKLKHKNYKN